jgi:hypothetical protein
LFEPDVEGRLLTSKFDFEVWESDSSNCSKFILSWIERPVAVDGGNLSSVKTSVLNGNSTVTRLDIL